MPDRVLQMLDEKIREIQDRLDRLVAIRVHMSEVPAIVTDLTSILGSSEANGRIVSPRGSDFAESPHLAPILAYLKKKKPEEWTTAKEIEEATKIERSVVYFILDRKHSELFEVNHPSPKRKFWRLKRDDIGRVTHRPA